MAKVLIIFGCVNPKYQLKKRLFQSRHTITPGGEAAGGPAGNLKNSFVPHPGGLTKKILGKFFFLTHF